MRTGTDADRMSIYVYLIKHFVFCSTDAITEGFDPSLLLLYSLSLELHIMDLLSNRKQAPLYISLESFSTAASLEEHSVAAVLPFSLTAPALRGVTLERLTGSQAAPHILITHRKQPQPWLSDPLMVTLMFRIKATTQRRHTAASH